MVASLMNNHCSAPSSAAGHAPDETAAGVLRHLEEQRGRLFTEAEYSQQRQTILAELSEGARLRPFTWFTFAIIQSGLVALLAAGLATARATGDYTLALFSIVAVLCAGSVFYQMRRAVVRDRNRSLQERLSELEEVRSQQLITPDEYHEIQAHILSARQQGEKIRE